MIPAVAVEDYLARSLDDHDWMKELDHDELDEALGKLRPRIRIHPDLGVHQKVAILLGVSYPQFCFWLDMGTGKTAVALHLIQYWWDCERMKRALVFVTSDKAFDTWEKQFERFDIRVPFLALDGTSAERWQAWEEFGNGVVLVPYPGAVAMACRRVAKKGKSKAKKLQLWPKMISRFNKDVDVVVWDESTRVGNNDSLAHRLGNRMTAPYRYALAGRPFGRDPTPLWAQFSIIDRGETLGDTLGMFREAFFTKEASKWTSFGTFKFDKKKKGTLAQMIRHRSISYDADECVDLPPFSSYIETLRLPEEAEGYYKRLVQQVIAAKGNLREMKNVFTRMRQVSSGYLGLKDDETGERLEVEFEQNPKLDRLLDLVDAIPNDRKAIIFYEFTHSGRAIAEELVALKHDAIWLWSGTKDARGELKRFRDRDTCRFCVVNNRLGAMSLDGLQIANYLIFYESPVSVIDREQAERRVKRQGQLHKVFQYDLVVQGTMDQRILDFHAEGEDIFQSLLREPSRLIR